MVNVDRLQESFLTILVQENILVSVFLVSGIKLHGVIESFDEHVITLKGQVTQMVYKHAISTVVPSRSIDSSSFNDDVTS